MVLNLHQVMHTASSSWKHDKRHDWEGVKKRFCRSDKSVFFIHDWLSTHQRYITLKQNIFPINKFDEEHINIDPRRYIFRFRSNCWYSKQIQRQYSKFRFLFDWYWPKRQRDKSPWKSHRFGRNCNKYSQISSKRQWKKDTFQLCLRRPQTVPFVLHICY